MARESGEICTYLCENGDAGCGIITGPEWGNLLKAGNTNSLTSWPRERLGHEISVWNNTFGKSSPEE